jgi:hypothetical protein
MPLGDPKSYDLLLDLLADLIVEDLAAEEGEVKQSSRAKPEEEPAPLARSPARGSMREQYSPVSGCK